MVQEALKTEVWFMSRRRRFGVT